MRKTNFIDQIPDAAKCCGYENGCEVNSGVIKDIPVDFKVPETLEQQIARLIGRSKFYEQFDAMPDESEEDALDFDGVEDNELDEELSFYQHQFATQAEFLDKNIAPYFDQNTGEILDGDSDVKVGQQKDFSEGGQPEAANADNSGSLLDANLTR